jgi:two-component system, chemotaxis family, sensor kinase Cph1
VENSELKAAETRLAAQAAELSACREQHKATQHELEAFIYSVSHDLRAPLRHITGFSRILRNDFGSTMSAEATELLEHIEEAIGRTGKLIDGLLTLSRLGRQSLQVQQNEIDGIVQQVISALQPECAGREVEWRIATLPALPCDAALMGHVFHHLVGNALKYSRRRSPAVIEIDSIQRQGEPVAIFVRDNGAGFNMKYAQRLFGVFQRMHTETEFEGIGIGLAAVKRIIQRHGGSVWAEAEIEHGATFYFTLGKMPQPR